MYLALPFSTVVNNIDTNILIKKFTTVINMSMSNVIETCSLNVHQPIRTVVQTFTIIISTLTNVITTCTLNVIRTVTNVIATLIM